MDNGNLNNNQENMNDVTQENIEPQINESVNEVVEEPSVSLGEATNNTLMDPEIVPEVTEPVVEEPVVAAEPVVGEPVVAAEPVVGEPVVAAEPVVEEPAVAAEPVMEGPAVAAEPVVEEPAVAAEPVVESAPATEIKKDETVKMPKSRLPLLLVLILVLALVLVYMLFGQKLFKKDKTPTPASNQVTIQEFSSLNGVDYFRIKDDNTYELNLTDEIYKDPTLVRDKKGKYTKVDNTYTLDNGAVVIVNNDYAEVTNLVNNSEEKYEDILFEKTKLETVRTTLNSNVAEYFKAGKVIVDGDVVKSEAEGKKAYENEVSNFAAELGSCYRLEVGNEAINKNEFDCVLSYKVYLKNYTQSACSEGEDPYVKWLAPNGHCESDHISHTDYISVVPTEQYRIAEWVDTPV